MTNIKDDSRSETNEELIKGLESLIVTFSSEGRTPLTTIVGYATLLEDGHLGNMSDEQLKAVKSMGMGARRVMNLINYVIDEMQVLNLLHERTRLNIERIDIRSWLIKTANRFSKGIENKEQ